MFSVVGHRCILFIGTILYVEILSVSVLELKIEKAIVLMKQILFYSFEIMEAKTCHILLRNWANCENL